MKFLTWCEQHKVFIAVYPLHSTHRLQPLDVSLFSPLATYYSQELDSWIHKTQDLCRLSKREFWGLFHPAWNRAITSKNILSGWKKTGLQPLNAEEVIQQIQLQESSQVTQRPPLSLQIISENHDVFLGEWNAWIQRRMSKAKKYDGEACYTKSYGGSRKPGFTGGFTYRKEEKTTWKAFISADI
jgi:hypothetical protein